MSAAFKLEVRGAELSLGPIDALRNHEFRRVFLVRRRNGMAPFPELEVVLHSTHRDELRLVVEEAALAVADDLLHAVAYGGSLGPKTLRELGNTLRAACGLPERE